MDQCLELWFEENKNSSTGNRKGRRVRSVSLRRRKRIKREIQGKNSLWVLLPLTRFLSLSVSLSVCLVLLMKQQLPSVSLLFSGSHIRMTTTTATRFGVTIIVLHVFLPNFWPDLFTRNLVFVPKGVYSHLQRFLHELHWLLIFLLVVHHQKQQHPLRWSRHCFLPDNEVKGIFDALLDFKQRLFCLFSLFQSCPRQWISGFGREKMHLFTVDLSNNHRRWWCVCQDCNFRVKSLTLCVSEHLIIF